MSVTLLQVNLADTTQASSISLNRIPFLVHSEEMDFHRCNSIRIRKEARRGVAFCLL